ncbi:MAG: ATP-binding protein [Candidatus Omnitrophica bacterium]|nr:ATP-binding protein [Candidatus Omnitrophota bacterium]
MKKVKQIIIIILIQILLCGQLSFAESFSLKNNHLIEKATLAPQVYINSDLFIQGFEQKLTSREEFLGKRYPFILKKASDLLNCTEVSQVQDIMEKVVTLLGFGRAKFYEVIKFDPIEKKWHIRQEMKTASKGEFSERYREEGLASDEKEYVLNQASRGGLDLFHETNRWAHLIGDPVAEGAYVNPKLIALDAAEFGQDKEQRVKEFLHIVLRNSKGKILGILSVDNWQKPLAGNPELSEPILQPDSDSIQKIKILTMFAQLSGLAMQRIRFKEKEQDIAKLHESEKILREILHELWNKIFRIRAQTSSIKSRGIRQRIKEQVVAIEKAFKNFSRRVRAGKVNMNIDRVLTKDGLVERVFQIIEESVALIRSQDIEQVSNLFSTYETQLGKEFRSAGNVFTPEQQNYFDFLNDFKELAIYQTGLFDRQEQLFMIQQEIQKNWNKIEQEVIDLRENKDPDVEMVFEKIFAAYQEAQIEYNKYTKLCEDLAANGFLQRSFNYQQFKISDLITIVNNRWLENKLESSIKIAPALPSIITDKEVLISVFNELIMNAQKYGSGFVGIEINLDNDEKDFLRVDFKTKGRGIAQNELGKVFQEEYRVNQSDGLGNGLGLNVVKKNIERMGGEISISSSRLRTDSQEGETVFTLKLPVVKQADLAKDDFLKIDASRGKIVNTNYLVQISI